MAAKILFVCSLLVASCRGNEFLMKRDVGPVELLWGVPDKEAYVGKLFELLIPNDAFKGDVLRYEFRSAENSTSPLPSWLKYNATSKILQGVPQLTDTRQHFVHVTAHGSSSKAHDVFTIAVLQPETDCPEISTMVKIVLDSVEKEAVPKDCHLIKKLARHLNISSGDVSLLRRDDAELLGESLISGPGNVFSLDAGKGTALSWGVGCGKVRAKHVKYLESLGKLAENGTLAKLLGRNIRGWSVNNAKVVKSKRRRRREIRQANKDNNIVSSKNNEEIEGSGPEWPITTPSLITTPGSASTHKCRHHHCDHTRKTTLGTTVSVEDIDLIRPTAVVTEEEMSSSVVLESIAPTRTPFNNNPVLGADFNKFDLPYAMPGKVFHYLIPQDTFSDIEEGNTRNLNLVLKSADHLEIDPMHWLQLDKENQTLWGMPTEDDHAKIGYILSAVDKGGKVAHATFFINIEKAPREEYTTHEFSIVIDYNFEEFRLGGSRSRVDLANKISKCLHPKEEHNTVRMLQIRRGSVRFSWRDSSIDGSLTDMSKRTSCPVNRIKRTVLKMIECENDMLNCIVRKDFLRAMKPWKIKSFSFQPVGKCSIGYDLMPLEVSTSFINIDTIPPEEYTSHEFSIIIDYNFEDFTLGSNQNQVDLANKISKYLHPKEANNTVRILEIRKGSVLFSWRDSSIDGSLIEMSKRKSCPVHRIKRTILKMVDCEDDMINCVVRRNFLRAVKPWAIKLFSFQPVGKCSLGYDLMPLEVAVEKDKIEKTKPVRPAATETTLTIIIASSLIAFVLLFGAIVACVLYRAKRKGKMSVTDKQTFVSKGIPVIFADELDDNPQSVTKPLILANEKPPETDPDQGRYVRPSTFSSGTSSFGQRPSPPAPSRQPPPYVPP